MPSSRAPSPAPHCPASAADPHGSARPGLEEGYEKGWKKYSERGTSLPSAAHSAHLGGRALIAAWAVRGRADPGCRRHRRALALLHPHGHCSLQGSEPRPSTASCAEPGQHQQMCKPDAAAGSCLSHLPVRRRASPGPTCRWCGWISPALSPTPSHSACRHGSLPPGGRRSSKAGCKQAGCSQLPLTRAWEINASPVQLCGGNCALASSQGSNPGEENILVTQKLGHIPSIV